MNSVESRDTGGTEKLIKEIFLVNLYLNMPADNFAKIINGHLLGNSTQFDYKTESENVNEVDIEIVF